MILNSILNFVKKNWKIVLLVISILVIIFSIKACNEYKKLSSDNAKAAHFSDSLYTSKVKEWKDANDELHATVDNLYVAHFQMQYELDSIAHLLSIKPKNITAISKTGTQINLDIKPVIDTVQKEYPANEYDSAYVNTEYNLSWRDNWMQVTGTINGITDSIHVSGTDTLNRVDYWKRKWFLGAKTHYTDFSNTNPHIKVVGYKGVTFKENEKRFSLNIALMYGYPIQNIDFKKPSLYFGLSTGYTIARF